MNRLLMVTTVAGTLRSFLAPVARHFRDRGWRVDAAARGVSGCSECRAAFDNVWEVGWSRRPWDIRSIVQCPARIRDLAQSERYDIVHVHTPVAAFVSRYALRGVQETKVVYTAHGFHFYKGGSWVRNHAFLALEKLAARWTDHLVVINREDQEATSRYRLIPPARVHHFPGGSSGVDASLYDPDSIGREQIEATRRELDLPEGAPLFLMVAEFIPRKRHEDALRAFALVRRRHPAYLAFAGRGPRMDAMRRLAQKLGISSCVRILGYREDTPSLMMSSVATLLPSTQEGCPRTVMESLSMGVPVIGSDIRGTHDLLENGCGVLVGVGNVEELAQAMLWLIEHPTEARNRGRLGRNTMVDHRLPRVLESYESLYALILREAREMA